MTQSDTRLGLRVGACFFLLLSAQLAFFGTAVGEERGGTLTGPMIILSEIGILFLGLTIPAVLLRWRIALALVCLGALALLPWESWRLFSGLWCKVVECAPSIGRAIFSGEISSLLLLASTGIAVFLTFQSVRK